MLPAKNIPTASYQKTSPQCSPTQEHLFPFINQSNQKAQWDAALNPGAGNSIFLQDAKDIIIDLAKVTGQQLA